MTAPTPTTTASTAALSKGRVAAHQVQVRATPWAGVHGTHIASARHYGRHWHATLGIGWLADGAQRSASGRGPVQARAGDLIASNPGEVHDGHPVDGAARRWHMLYLEPTAASTWLDPDRRGDVELARPVFHDPVLRAALQRLFARLAAWSPGADGSDGAVRLACDEALADIAACLSQHTAAPARTQPPAGDSPLARVRDRLADDLLHAPTLDELATLAGCSRFQVLRRFQQAHGLPPHAWLLQQRLERARGLISQGVALVQAAADSGFADQSHLTRHFTRQFGFTPGAWRAAIGLRSLQ